MTTQTMQAKIADRPEVSESFGDFVRAVWFDGNTWRIDIDTSRLDPPKEGVPMSTTRYPSCRLVLSVFAGIALLDRLTELAKELEANGTLKRTPVPQKPVVTH